MIPFLFPHLKGDEMMECERANIRFGNRFESKHWPRLVAVKKTTLKS